MVWGNNKNKANKKKIVKKKLDKKKLDKKKKLKEKAAKSKHDKKKKLKKSVKNKKLARKPKVTYKTKTKPIDKKKKKKKHGKKILVKKKKLMKAKPRQTPLENTGVIKVKEDKDKKLTYNDIINDNKLSKSFLRGRTLMVNNANEKTVFHIEMEKEIASYPNYKGPMVRDSINSIDFLLNTDYDFERKKYKHDDEKYEHFKKIFYLCHVFSEYWLVESTKGQTIAIEKHKLWRRDQLFIENVWEYTHSTVKKNLKLEINKLLLKELSKIKTRLK